MDEKEIRITEQVRQGTNPHIYWCTAKKNEEDEGNPCLMIKETALSENVKISIDEETKDLVIIAPAQIMVSLMQDAYQSRDGKPFELRIARTAIKSMTTGKDYVAFIMAD